MFQPADLKRRSASLWRYREALGIDLETQPVTLGEGGTPLSPATIHGKAVWLKQDHLCPTGSYKDRGSTVMLTQLKRWGIGQIVEDSSGNAGASVAAYSAVAGIAADIYIPETTSAGKAAQIGMYGARLVKVPGSREDTARAAWDAGSASFYASHNWSPYFLAGMKTAAYEMAEQLDWSAPDWIVTPVGGGGLLVGLYLGFRDLLESGITTRMPRIAAIQAAACAPIYRAWRSGATTVEPVVKGTTAAEGISVAQPVRGPHILEAVRKSDGVVRTVDDEEVWRSLQILGRAGVYVEPTSATVAAALPGLCTEGLIAPDDCVVLYLTGSGLKATDKIVAHFQDGDPGTAHGQRTGAVLPTAVACVAGTVDQR
jgi:threonine synthase